MTASKWWLMPEKSKQPGQLLVRIAAVYCSHMLHYDAESTDEPVANPRAFKDAAAATTAGTGVADARDSMMTDAASAPCTAAHSD
jgi:hypothetical protein